MKFMLLLLVALIGALVGLSLADTRVLHNAKINVNGVNRKKTFSLNNENISKQQFVIKGTETFPSEDGYYYAPPVQHYARPVQHYARPVQHYARPVQHYARPVQHYAPPVQHYNYAPPVQHYAKTFSLNNENTSKQKFVIKGTETYPSDDGYYYAPPAQHYVRPVLQRPPPQEPSNAPPEQNINVNACKSLLCADPTLIEKMPSKH